MQTEKQNDIELLDAVTISNLIHACYINFLGRSPSEYEISEFRNGLLVNDLAKSLARWFHDFEPLAQAKNWGITKSSPPTDSQLATLSSLRKIAFLHIPKTSGTRLRHQIPYKLNIDWLDITNFSHDLLFLPVKSFIDFWPLLMGHSTIAHFSSSHTVFSFFREPRSRLLSLYGASFEHTETPEILRRLSLRDFLETCWADSDLAPFFWPLHRFFANSPNSDTEEDHLVSHVNYAQWSHESQNLSKTITNWIGRSLDFEPTKTSNKTNYSKLSGLQKSLSKSDLSALEYFAGRENLVLDKLVANQKLGQLSATVREALYRKTLSHFNLI